MIKAIPLVALGFPVGVSVPVTAIMWHTGTGTRVVEHKLFEEYREEPYYSRPAASTREKFASRIKNRKLVDIAKGKEIIETLKDYTVRVQNGTCGEVGTGWFFDYEVPKEGKYPITWYIATNMHLLSNVSKLKNEYNQTLPIPKTDCDNSKLTFFRPSVKNPGSDTDYNPTSWKPNEQGFEPANWWYDIYKNAYTTKPYDYLTFTPSKPNLFYVPINYLGKNKTYWNTNFPNQNYAGNLAIVEVTFDHEMEAKVFTNYFYDKYDHTKGKQKEKALKFFEKPMLEEKKPEQILDEDTNIFMFGYPEEGLKRGTSNLRTNTQLASKLEITNEMIKVEDEEVIGHLNLGHIKSKEIPWNNQNYGRRGYGYIVDLSLGKGMSGSLAVDDNRNVLGILSKWEHTIYGEIDPLRNQEIKNEFGEVINPKYDFLEGADGQLSSYKLQVQKHILSKNKQTNLSVSRGWEKLPDSQTIKTKG